MDDFTISFIVSICLGVILLFFILQNIYLSSKNRELILNLKEREADVAELKAKLFDKPKIMPNSDVLRILSDMNAGGSLLRVERVDPDHVFQWHPNDRIQ